MTCIGHGEAREKQLRRGDMNASRRFMGNLREDIVHETAESRFGVYAAAVERWELVTRPAPNPTQTNKAGNQQLDPRFVEWMMGLPAGWVADVPGLTRRDQIKMLGNGVVPQQAEAAITQLLERGGSTNHHDKTETATMRAR